MRPFPIFNSNFFLLIWLFYTMPGGVEGQFVNAIMTRTLFREKSTWMKYYLNYVRLFACWSTDPRATMSMMYFP